MTALYQLAAEHRALAERLADLDLDQQTVLDTLESMSGALEDKATNVALFARNLEAVAANIKEAEDSMAKRRKALEQRATSLRRYLLESMRAAGVHRVESPFFVLSVKQNPPAVDVFDAGQLPLEYMRVPDAPPPAPDKTKIAAALKVGVDVPGAKLVNGTRLDIKV